MDFDQILCMHWYWQDVDLDDWTIFFVHFQQSYGLWSMLKFHLCSISCVPPDGFWSNIVNALILTKCRQGQLQIIFCYFSTVLWPWLMSEFCFHLIFWEQIDEFWWNCVYAILWIAHKIFLNFSTELWPLIDVKIPILEIMNGYWYNFVYALI